MSITGIGQNYYMNNAATTQRTKNVNSSTKGDFGASVKGASGAENVVHLAPDALFSIYDAQTGESANVYRADDYTEENPLYLIKGTDKNGNEYEQTVDVSKVNPNGCSYTEMLALNAHTGNKSDSNFLSMAIMKDKAGTSSYHEKTDWLSAAYALMDDMKTLGNWDGYLRYSKWVNDIMTFCKNKAPESGNEADSYGNGVNSKNEGKTEIIVKPDGSRVLVMTMSTGGMETTMSMEISKPTKEPNDNSGQDTDSQTPAADVEMDAVDA